MFHAPALLLVLVLVAPSSSASAQDGPGPAFGHSQHGVAYDEGPRQRPWHMDGIGSAPFAITTSVPEVQQWFDQGNALLHSFAYYEAERAFRWCVKLDPDCAMAYLGLARAVPYARERAAKFLAQAVERKAHASAHEQAWIDAFAKTYLQSLDHPDPAKPGWNATSRELADALEKVIVDYPDDIEAKAVYALNIFGLSSPYAVDAVLQQVFVVAPEHPGAIHYRIHNWDSREFGRLALDSCAAYGRIAPALGHANHMPAHIYTSLGMWHEGAISLDAATRVEKQYMRDRMVLPYLEWNYPHNRNFLAHAQSMLGLPTAALQGAYDMLNAPLDPDANDDGLGYSVFREGLAALRRTLVRFERWDTILEPGHIPWRNNLEDSTWRDYCEALAHIGRNELAQAEECAVRLLGAKKKLEQEVKNADQAVTDDNHKASTIAGVLHELRDMHPIMMGEVSGRLRLKRGDTQRGIEELSEAARLEAEMRKHDADPPTFPRSIYNVLGEAYLDLDSPQLAVSAFEKSLESLPNNGWSWSGLARAHQALGHVEDARIAYAHMLHVWSHAEPGIRQLEAARALGIQTEPSDPSPAPQRDYFTQTLSQLGPNTWQPYPAPELIARDSEGERVTLDQYRGKNVLLIFYLSDRCVHCVEQLQAIEKRAAEFDSRNTVVLAISSDQPDRNAAGELKSLPFRVLSDTPDHQNAIRFKSFDEFEDIELHSTNLIDAQGRLRWLRTGGDPFMNLDFLLKEIDRIAEIDRQGRLIPLGAAPAGR
ncbi:MAG: redoxin domain-containing protein [Planctomycetota bacterium]